MESFMALAHGVQHSVLPEWDVGATVYMVNTEGIRGVMGGRVVAAPGDELFGAHLSLREGLQRRTGSEYGLAIGIRLADQGLDIRPWWRPGLRIASAGWDLAPCRSTARGRCNVYLSGCLYPGQPIFSRQECADQAGGLLACRIARCPLMNERLSITLVLAGKAVIGLFDQGVTLYFIDALVPVARHGDQLEVSAVPGGQ